MSDEVYWIYVVSVADGAFEQFEGLIHELVDASRKEAGTIAYQFWTDDDGRTVNVFEHYENSAAIVFHVGQTLSRFKDRMASLTTVKSVTVYGNPDEAARHILDGWGSVYMGPIAGFRVEPSRGRLHQGRAVPTALLRDRSVSDAIVANAVVDLGEKGASDGLEADDKGRIYAGDFEHNSIRQRQIDGEWTMIAHDPRILWPDTLSVASNGYFYFTVNQLQRQARFN